MNRIFPLSDLQPGQKAVVAALLSSGDIRRRLQDMGIIPGTKIICGFKSPWGDPAAYEIRQTTIAIRKKDAANILVTAVSPPLHKKGGCPDEESQADQPN